ncbi:MAG: hypothetical protein V4635_08990 [Bacteroidota bacterium]
MNYYLHKPVQWFFTDYRFKFQTYWFKNLLYLFLIMKAVGWLLSYDLFFGERAVVYSNYFSVSNFKDIAFLLYASSSPLLAYAFLIPLLFLCLVCLKFKKPWFVADVLIWFLVLNLSNKVYPTLTGGDYLLNQLLFFNCFLSASFTVDGKIYSDLKVCLHNLAVVAVMLQVCIVYFLSALAKINDAEWLSGGAAKDISLINHFNLYGAAGAISFPDSLMMFMTYLILFYQLLFPVLIWLRPIKKPFIMVGLLMHLYIALVMGLVEFGLIMLLCYIYFWPSRKTIS